MASYGRELRIGSRRMSHTDRAAGTGGLLPMSDSSASVGSRARAWPLLLYPGPVPCGGASQRPRAMYR